MYLHRVYSPEFFAIASGRKSTRKIFRQATELIVPIDHEFVGNSTSPPFAPFLCPFYMGISVSLGKRLTGVLWDTHGWKTTKSNSCAKARFVYLLA